MAVTRSGQLPLDFEYAEYADAPTQSMVDAVGRYFDRFQYEDRSTDFPRPYWRFHLIFDLCPLLEVLYLHCNFVGALGDVLPARPAPRTLRKVMLDSWTSCNLLQLYAVWKLQSVADVQLQMPLGISARIAPFVSGAVELSLLFEGDREAVHIDSQLSDARTRKLTCEALVVNKIATLAEILQDGDALSHLHTLTVPLSVLSLTLAGAYRWPRLAHLSVHIYADDVLETHHDGAPRSSWEELKCLRAAPALESLALHVHTSDGACDPPALDNARDLRQYLATLSRSIPREVKVYGFTAAIVHEMRALDSGEPRVLFY
ncbi:hypothetical protein AURDEDRAFT_171169 [Auricularia subglabra TFB-10046 SS5]|uniref:F-box domain-containing protein n=1 Tax=Auricularia subglabra (strain TFB-10046 / SS5) TaxID=717982 RepID=J0DCA0_AURST|nr:hypothetical protein AURDEDRAFT_171169 [Auricularia subglabra TFB-10046 SS5]